MTESDNFNEVLGTLAPSENGHEAASSVDAAPVQEAHLDVERGVFITSEGNEIELSGKRVSALMLERLINEGKPRIPMKEVTILGKHKQMEANPNDPGYLALLAEWETNQKIKALIYVFTVGVKGQPDEAFVEEQRAFFPDASDATIKYLWVSSRVPDRDVDTLSEAIIGQSIPTQKGLAQSAETFRS